MENSGKLKAGAIAIVAPTIFFQILMAIVVGIFMEFTVWGWDGLKHIGIINAVVYGIVLFPEIYLNLPKLFKSVIEIKVGIMGRILPYAIWVFFIYDSIIRHYDIVKM